MTLTIVVPMHKPRLGEGKRGVLLAMEQVNLLKLVTVVDDDIDIENAREVGWVLAARFRGNEDLIVIPGVKADRCDPVHDNLTVTKIGMVATTRPGDGEPFTRSELVRAPDRSGLGSQSARRRLVAPDLDGLSFARGKGA